jgi:hypothetical protein
LAEVRLKLEGQVCAMKRTKVVGYNVQQSET